MISLRIAAAALLLSAPLINVGYAQAGGQIVEIDLDSYSFTPKTLHLKRGDSYTLHFVNKSSKGHNFDAPQFFAALSIAPEDQAKVAEGKLDVGSGQAVDVKVVANTAGKYSVKCSRFMHSTMGMTGEAVIE